VDRPAPDFTLRDLNGKPHSLSEYRGMRPVVLVFLVGDICPYCPGQIAQLRKQRRRIEELGASLLMIESHEKFRLKTTMRNSGAAGATDFPILADPSQTVSASYGVAMHARAHTEWSNRPASFVIDRSGIIRLAHRDPADHRIDPEDLIQVLQLVNHLDGAVANRKGHSGQGNIGL
jgi:peroxiredoxin